MLDLYVDIDMPGLPQGGGGATPPTRPVRRHSRGFVVVPAESMVHPVFAEDDGSGKGGSLITYRLETSALRKRFVSPHKYFLKVLWHLSRLGISGRYSERQLQTTKTGSPLERTRRAIYASSLSGGDGDLYHENSRTRVVRSSVAVDWAILQRRLKTSASGLLAQQRAWRQTRSYLGEVDNSDPRWQRIDAHALHAQEEFEFRIGGDIFNWCSAPA